MVVNIESLPASLHAEANSQWCEDDLIECGCQMEAAVTAAGGGNRQRQRAEGASWKEKTKAVLCTCMQSRCQRN